MRYIALGSVDFSAKSVMRGERRMNLENKESSTGQVVDVPSVSTFVTLAFETARERRRRGSLTSRGTKGVENK